jgi:hypothetical protein
MRTDPFREFDEAWEQNREMNHAIRARARSLRRPPRSDSEPDPEPQSPASSRDLGAGPRPTAPRSDPHGDFRRWLWQQAHRARSEAVDVNMKRRKP